MIVFDPWSARSLACMKCPAGNIYRMVKKIIFFWEFRLWACFLSRIQLVEAAVGALEVARYICIIFCIALWYYYTVYCCMQHFLLLFFFFFVKRACGHRIEFGGSGHKNQPCVQRWCRAKAAQRVADRAASARAAAAEGRGGGAKRPLESRSVCRMVDFVL